MEIKLLEKGYKNNEKFYKAFCEDALVNSEYVSEESIWIPEEIPDFKIYFPMKDENERKNNFIPTIEIMDKKIISLDRDYFMDERFWHSIFCLYKREYLIEQYPEIIASEKAFRNIVIKTFNWENYVYKAILIAQYVADNRADEKQKYYNLILDNLDMFNYIIKYEIFRNGNFLMNIMDIIDETGLSIKLKEKIKDRPDLGNDERYGRRVILELNKSYPIVMSPMLDKEILKEHFLKYLAYYINYNMLKDDEENEIPYVLFEKKVDKSLLKEGMSIPEKYQDELFEKLGIQLGVGESIELKVLIDGNEYEAVLKNQSFDENKYYGHVPVVQIRYSANSAIAKYLRIKFSKSYYKFENKKDNETNISLGEDIEYMKIIIPHKGNVIEFE